MGYDKKYDEVYKELLSELNDKLYNERLTSIYALILLALKISNSVFKWSFDYDEVKKLIIASNASRKTQADKYEEYLDTILSELSLKQNKIIFIEQMEYVNKNNIRMAYDKAFKAPQDVIGMWNKINKYELIINRKVIDEILIKCLDSDKRNLTNVYKYFRSKHYINTYSTGFAKKHPIGAGRRIPCICFNTKNVFNGRNEIQKKLLPDELAERIKSELLTRSENDEQ